MTIRTKAFYVIWGILCLLIVTLLVLRVVFIFRNADYADREEIRRGARLAVRLLEREANELGRVATDYSGWDDTYEYIVSRDAKFIESNFPPSTFSNNSLDLAILLDAAGQSAYAETYNPELNACQPVPEEVLNLIAGDREILQRAADEGGAAGVWMLLDTPTLLAYRPILKSDLTGPVKGTLIFGRRVDSDMLASVSQLTGKRVTVLQLEDPAIPGHTQDALRRGNFVSDPPVDLPGAGIAVGYSMLVDGHGRPTCVIRCEGKRADRTTYILTAALAGGTLLLGLAISGISALFLLDRLLFQRLTKLHSLVADVQRTRDYSLRAEDNGGDEICELSAAFNGLLASLQANLEERARASKALEVSDERFRALLQHSSDVIALFDGNGIVSYISPSVQRVLGYDPEAILGHPSLEFVYPDDRPECRRLFEEASAKSGNAMTIEFRAYHADRSLHWIEAIAENLLDDPSVGAILVTVRDISERKRTGQLLAENERRLREVASRTGQLVYDYDRSLGRIVWEGAIEAITGYPSDVRRGIEWAEWEKMIAPQHVSRVLASLDLAGISGRAYMLEYRLTRADGSSLLVEDSGMVVKGDTAGVPRFLGSITDISEARAREDALVESRNALQTVIDNVYEAIIVHDRGGNIVEVNEKMLKMYGLTRAQALRCTIADLSVAEQSLDDAKRNWSRVLAGNNMLFEWKAQRPNDKSEFDVEVYLTSISLRGSVYILASVRDLTEIHEAQLAANESEARFRELLERTSLLALMLDANGMITFCNDSFVAMTGWSREELLGSDYYETIVAPEERAEARQSYQRCIDDGVAQSNVQRTIVTKSGSRRNLVWDTTHLRDGSGIRIGIATIGRDVTDHRRLEEQYRQSQKMEAVGQLAGGVAHDFNNLLQVISGYIDLTLDEMPRSNAAYAQLNEVKGAASRATTLVRQLLTFSRKDTAQLTSVNLNAVIANVLKLIRRVIGEHIVLETSISTELPFIHGDLGQLDQVLMNLCVNARDAMPSGGTIQIKTEAVSVNDEFVRLYPWAREGKYVLLEVADTGHGMSQEVQSHIFEPFYTTKEVGKGTGLGLATVYGVVKQHSGFIHVYSELNKGTVFRIYLPTGVNTPESGFESQYAPASTPSGTETILVAEDEEQVRKLTSKLLQNAGYTVLLANDGEEALRIFESHKEQISLCLLDVVMPKKSGKAVYDVIMALKPGMKVLFCSGYSFGMLAAEHLPETGVQVIQKPYSPGVLLRQIRESLDAPVTV
ncbi:MAG: PAS domain S-box protein [Candidatus Hydrogenedentes bacterium]|nr:PAS domain S-box protein [Candidatus Hydrogenedentota bacterium]